MVTHRDLNLGPIAYELILVLVLDVVSVIAIDVDRLVLEVVLGTK